MDILRLSVFAQRFGLDLSLPLTDGPPQSGVAQGFNLIQVSGVGDAVGDEKMRKRGRRNIQQKT